MLHLRHRGPPANRRTAVGTEQHIGQHTHGTSSSGARRRLTCISRRASGRRMLGGCRNVLSDHLDTTTDDRNESFGATSSPLVKRKTYLSIDSILVRKPSVVRLTALDSQSLPPLQHADEIGPLRQNRGAPRR